ncbi:MAG TPA: GNAT family N-acetyltransferase [Lentisphaeria bacterium]|nr:MAG: GNAT family N-acetyltransferase [Lentisphaerae bacterium GWF2_38_69]HBM16754.1 GNAT family N-acetyltransferase [Lentisphaeria bacterium]
MQFIIKKTDKKNFFQTENLTREAFWNIYRQGCVEHLVLNKIRKSTSCIQELDLMAVDKEKIIGHLISTKAKVIFSENNEKEILCMGPISVSPDLQKKGIGSKLIVSSVLIAKEMGYKGMILFGNPDYYHRFGFRNAKEFEITTKDGQNFEPFMALELDENSLRDIKGRFIEDASFTTTEEELEEFEKLFPYKKKEKTATQFEH